MKGMLKEGLCSVTEANGAATIMEVYDICLCSTAGLDQCLSALSFTACGIFPWFRQVLWYEISLKFSWSLSMKEVSYFPNPLNYYSNDIFHNELSAARPLSSIQAAALKHRSPILGNIWAWNQRHKYEMFTLYQHINMISVPMFSRFIVFLL